jgi:hypothetical protein
MKSTDGHLAGRPTEAILMVRSGAKHGMSSHSNGRQRRFSNHGIAGAFNFAPMRLRSDDF